MSKPKDEVRRMLDDLPDEATLKDIEYHVHVIQKINEGLRDVEEGRGLEEAAVKQRMERWLKK